LNNKPTKSSPEEGLAEAAGAETGQALLGIETLGEEALFSLPHGSGLRDSEALGHD
jgi:hypothetical protein